MKFNSLVLLVTLTIVAAISFQAGGETRVNTIHTQRNNITYWIPPKDITKKYIYYLSGYDADGRPIYIVEIGKWDVRAAVEKGGKDLENLKNHVRQLFYKIEQGGKFSDSEEEDNSPNSVVIFDWNGYDLLQLASSRTVQLMLKQLGHFKNIEESISYGFFINVNSAAETIVSLARPVMGITVDHIEVFGTERTEWEPAILKKIPKSQLPPWYGGNPRFKPVAIFG